MLSTWLLGVLYLALFVALVTGLLFWRRRQRRDRRPFPADLKLLRGPGETVRQRLAQLDESLAEQVLFALAIPLGVAAALLWLTVHLTGMAQGVSLLVTLAGVLAVMVLVARHLVRRLNESANHYLGLFGERVVAEALEPLKAQGFRIFHDVPGGGSSATFNIDHIAVGPSGIFAIETKTRRKGRARGGFAEHEIIYDGQVLAYPWGEDRHGLEQARRQAQWLGDWLARMLGARPSVTPILTFPGWMIIRRGTGAVVVLNPKEIPAALQLRGAPVLPPEQIDLIARQLDAVCRDVAY
ncbi:MAG TPA: nuclease-related domain-containing protein [Opitutaceae bacterium]|nr:nuclease-related domain-containing protein [Opitutaceae bacterium]